LVESSTEFSDNDGTIIRGQQQSQSVDSSYSMGSSIENDGTRTQQQTGDNSNSVDLFIENKAILVSLLYLNVKTIFL